MCMYQYAMYLDPTFYRFHGHVLLDRGMTCEFDHSLVNSYFLVRLVEVSEPLWQLINHWSDLSQMIVSWWSPCRKSGVVGKVEVARDLPEAIPGYPVRYGGVVESGVGAPVIVECWKVSNSHEDTKSEVCSKLLPGSFPSRHTSLPSPVLHTGCSARLCPWVMEWTSGWTPQRLSQGLAQ